MRAYGDGGYGRANNGADSNGSGGKDLSPPVTQAVTELINVLVAEKQTTQAAEQRAERLEQERDTVIDTVLQYRDAVHQVLSVFETKLDEALRAVGRARDVQ